MTKYKYTEKCSLLVSSCDDYATTWHPFFELIKRFWPNHPSIFLNSETKKYYHDDLSIFTICGGQDKTWSERLLKSLEMIPTEYIIFSLEDAFLLGNVNDDEIEQCFNWMEENSNIAECRLKASNNSNLEYSDIFKDYRLAGNNVAYRLDTQVALWRKSDLISFIDCNENPWQFETLGTERIKTSDKIFLWRYSEKEEDVKEMPYPYHINQCYGYGVAWSKWLWANKKWFKKNNILGVKYRVLGILPKWAVKLRFKYLYRVGKTPAKGFARLFQRTYRILDRFEKAIQQIRLHGIIEGIKRINIKRGNKS